MVLYKYIVTGAGFFPMDMLRYDHCWPADNDAVIEIQGPMMDERKILLASIQAPTEARWESFGWSCSAITKFKI